MFTAVVRVTGAGRLADFRERLRWLMVRDLDAEDYTEHHADGRLEYRFAPDAKAFRFPSFTEASRRVSRAARRGRLGPRRRARPRGDRERPRDRGRRRGSRSGPPGIDVELDAGRRAAARAGVRAARRRMARLRRDAPSGTPFSAIAAALELIAPEDARRRRSRKSRFALSRNGSGTTRKRRRSSARATRSYGFPVRGANLSSEKLALLRGSGLRFSSLDAAATRGARGAR